MVYSELFYALHQYAKSISDILGDIVNTYMKPENVILIHLCAQIIQFQTLVAVRTWGRYLKKTEKGDFSLIQVIPWTIIVVCCISVSKTLR